MATVFSMLWRAKVSAWSERSSTRRQLTLQDLEILDVHVFAVHVELDLGHGNIHWHGQLCVAGAADILNMLSKI
jgi:hypothetical protein